MGQNMNPKQSEMNNTVHELHGKYRPKDLNQPMSRLSDAVA